MRKNIILTLILTAIAFLLMSGSCQDTPPLTDTACLWIVTFQQSEGLKLVNPGGTYNFIRQVNNDGPANCNNIVLRYFFSTDEVINTSDTYLNKEETLNLASGGYSTSGVNLIVPSWAISGTKYYIGVLIVSSSCTNNCSAYKSWDVTISGSPITTTTSYSTSTSTIPPGPTTTTTSTTSTTSATTSTSSTSTSTTSSTTTSTVCTYNVVEDFGATPDECEFGNCNSKFQPNEQVVWAFGVRNDGNCDLTDCYAWFSCPGSCDYATLNDQRWDIGTLPKGGVSKYDAYAFLMTIDSDAPDNYTEDFRIRIYCTQGGSSPLLTIEPINLTYRW